MYITRVPNRGSPPAVLLRESYRENAGVNTRTLANPSRWPEHQVDKLQRALKGRPSASDPSEAFEITRSPRTGMWPRCWAPPRSRAWPS